MPTKKPIVLTNGQYQELQSGDNINISAQDIVSGVIATARLASVGTPSASTFLRGDQTWATPAGGGGSSSPTITIFTSSGIYTNPQTGYMRVILVGAGGGGGSGRRGASGSAKFGGGAGPAGGQTIAHYAAANLPASIPVYIGAGGAGGTAQTGDNLNGNAGGAGGATIFGGNGTITDLAMIGVAQGGAGGLAGQGAAVNTTANVTHVADGMLTSTVHGNNPPNAVNPPTTASLAHTQTIGTHGGIGGGSDASNNSYSGGAAGRQAINPIGTTIIMQTSGGLVNQAGTNGSTQYGLRNQYLISTGGGGGGCGTTAAGGRGGDGGIGSSGGGGGASFNGFDSGAGGTGGAGIAIIIHWV